jgi:hypothetical protein
MNGLQVFRAFAPVSCSRYPEIMPPDSSHLGEQVVWLLVLAVPIACLAWTVTHEEVFREPREFCIRQSKACRSIVQRKFFYLFTCEYCFSHYITAIFLWMTHFRLLLDDWRGYVIAFFALVWVCNAYLSLFGRLRVEIRGERAAADVKQHEAKVKQKQVEHLETQISGKRFD